MAKLSTADILKLAQLSRLHLTDDEIERFRGEIEAILEYVQQLQSVDLKNVEPTSQVTGLKNVMRSDEEKDYGASAVELLKNAPKLHEGQIKVRRML